MHSDTIGHVIQTLSKKISVLLEKKIIILKVSKCDFFIQTGVNFLCLSCHQEYVSK